MITKKEHMITEEEEKKQQLEYIIRSKGYCSATQSPYVYCTDCYVNKKCVSFVSKNGSKLFTAKVKYKFAVEMYIKKYGKSSLLELLI